MASQLAMAVFNGLRERVETKPEEVVEHERVAFCLLVDTELQEVREVLEGIFRVADRKTVEFDRARALHARLQPEQGTVSERPVKDLRIYDHDNRVVTQGAFNALMSKLDSLEEDLECVTTERDNRQQELDHLYATELQTEPEQGKEK